MDVDGITPVAQDYLKVIWSATEWGDAPITTGELAARFGTSAASVTDTIRRLTAQGLVEYTPYRPVRLTDLGRTYAVAMVRRHRLIETFLVTTLGYGWDEVHVEAERLEHAVSDDLVDRIDTFLGHPSADPHGDPIPDRSGRVSVASTATSLDDARTPGRYRVIRVSDADAGTLAAASSAGIVPGVELERTDASAPTGGRRIVVGGRRVVVGDELGAAVWVVPAEDAQRA